MKIKNPSSEGFFYFCIVSIGFGLDSSKILLKDSLKVSSLSTFFTNDSLTNSSKDFSFFSSSRIILYFLFHSSDPNLIIVSSTFTDSKTDSLFPILSITQFLILVLSISLRYVFRLSSASSYFY